MPRIVVSFLLEIIANFGYSQQLDCLIEEVGRASEDGTSWIPESIYDHFEGSSFRFNLANGEIEDLGEIEGHTWRRDVYAPNFERSTFTTRLLSETLPETQLIFNFFKRDQPEPGELFSFMIIVRGGHLYAGKCSPA